MTKTVQEATADLSHTVANVVLLLDNATKLVKFMSDAEVGRYAMGKLPELRAALDELKAARIRESLEIADPFAEEIRQQQNDYQAWLALNPEQ